MKHPSHSVAGMLLAASFVAVFSAFLIGKASSNPDSDPASRDWQLGAPITHENLTIFPVISDTPDNTDEWITLDEGLRSGKVIVTELGGDNRSTPTRTVQRNPTSNNAGPQQGPDQNRVIQQQITSSSDSAQVNKVAVTNNSGKTLILIAGEVILGGKQDRIVGHDCIVASTNQPTPIDVFCVEHGRWQASSTGRDPAVVNRNGGGAGFYASPKEVMAAPKVRANAQAEKSQTAVWAEVADKVSKNKVSTSTGTLNSVYEDKQVSSRLAEYEQAVKSKFTGAKVIGAVIAVNGKVISADVFASPRLFQAYWTKLLKSYALEAVSTEKPSKQEVKASDAEAFLSHASGTDASVEKDGMYRISEKQSAADASFALESTAKSGKLIHFNRVSKK